MMNRRSLIRSAPALVAGLSLPGRVHAAPAALDDLAIVRRALGLHPGLYRYQSPRAFAQTFDRFARAWSDRTDRVSRFLALSRLTAQVRCGHTQCNPYNQSDAVIAELFDRTTRVPFRFRWLGDKMVVLGDSGHATGIARGSTIERLNERAPAELLRALMPYARADGSNDAKRIVQLEMRGDEKYEIFDLLQGLLFPPGPDGHHVVWRDPQGRSHSAILPAVDYARRVALSTDRPDDGVMWDWDIDAQGIATLTMPSWVTYKSDWDWRGWLTERFAGLRGARGLVIDIRRNEGGTDCGTWMLERMIKSPFKPLRYINRVRFRTVEADLVPYLSTWDRSFRTLGEGARDDGDGLFTLTDADDEAELLIRPAPDQIPVPVAVLMGPINSSATFSFVRRVREAAAARLVGQPSGGNLRGINGGAMFFVGLPESGLEFDLPLKGYFPERPQPDGPVMPHIRVATTQRDIALGNDPEMARAKAVLLAG